MMKKIFFVTVVLLSFTSAADAFTYTLGTTNYPYSTQAKPAKAASYIDTTMNTTVTRVTNSTTDHGAWGTGAGYSTWNPLSSDGKYLVFMQLSNLSSAAGYVLYDASTFAFIKTLPALNWWNSQDPEPRWDRTGIYPTRLYYRKDKQLRYIDVVTNVDGLVRDFSADFPAYGSGYAIWNGEEGSPSLDGRFWAFMLGNSNTNIPRVFVYDQLNDVVVASKNVAGKTVNNVMMSPSGNYVYVAYDWTGAGGEFDGPHAYTRDFTSNVKICNSIPHLNFAYSAQGNEVAFYMDSDYVSFTRLDTGQKFLLYYQGDLGWDASNLLHASGSKTKKGWGVISTYSENYGFWDYNQIFAIELNETKVYGSATPPRIWRISFAQNIVGANYYYQQPNAQMDQDGTRIWWGANWRSVSGNSEIYQVTLPLTWWEDLANLSGIPVITTTSTLPAAWTGTPYSNTLTASSGTPPYTWSATGLPAGLSIDPSTGRISGTASAGAAGIYNVVATAAGAGLSGSKYFTLSVTNAPVSPTITTTTLPAGVQGTVYSYPLSASGGGTPYSWSASGLPTGLTVISSTGVISGTPTAGGIFSSIVVTVTGGGLSSSKTFSMTIAKTPKAPSLIGVSP